MVKTLLIADDDSKIRDLVSATLEDDENYRLIFAANGDEAIEAARREKPDLAIVDIMMPIRDGFEVCEALKSNTATRRIKVVMLTALAQETHWQRAMALGADDYMTKPFSPRLLLERLDQLLAE